MLGYLSLPVAQRRHGTARRRRPQGRRLQHVQRPEILLRSELTVTHYFAPRPAERTTNRSTPRSTADRWTVSSRAKPRRTASRWPAASWATTRARTCRIYDALARDFAVGHRWFATHPGPTFPNRFYELTGRPNIDPCGAWDTGQLEPDPASVHAHDLRLPQRSLRSPVRHPITWRYFEHPYCIIRLYERYTFDHTNIVDMLDDPRSGFFAFAKTGHLPYVSFIEPHYVDYPPDSNCDEPTKRHRQRPRPRQRIVEAVVASPLGTRRCCSSCTTSTAASTTTCRRRRPRQGLPELPIKTYGVRVPSFVISPWVAAGTVFGQDGTFAGDAGASACCRTTYGVRPRATSTSTTLRY